MKLNLQLISAALLLSVGVTAQTGKKGGIKTNLGTAQQPVQSTEIKHRNCGTGTPSQEWNDWFNKKVEEYQANLAAGKTQMVNYTIPVIVHVIHGGQSVGTFPNLSQAQVNSQITVLNQDYAGTGFNVSNLAATAFSAVGAANSGISFCAAQKDPLGNTLAEPGIDRISYVAKGWTNPASFTSISAFQSYVDGTIKPNSIWNPSNYLNVWVTDVNGSVGLLGYATFPAGSGLTGISSNFGTATTDGVWCWSAAYGNTGTLQAPFNKGRTATHEIGHWLGLRHIGGDGNGNASGDCNATDYVSDTPPQKGGFGGGAYGQNYGAPTYPLHATGSLSCTAAAPNGDMFMNFMDYTDDPAMYMFTPGQAARFQTCMQNGTYRVNLNAASATLCTLSSAAPTASMAMAASGCTGTPVGTSNLSSGSPAPTYSWSANPSSGVTFAPSNSATTPSITFANPGSYTITVAATNSVGSNSNSKVITINSCTTAALCNDTLSNYGVTDTMTVYKGAPDSGTPGCSPNSGYVAGNNCYGDLEKAEFFAYSKYSGISSAQIKGVIVLFFKNGTQGTGGATGSSVGMKIYNSTTTTFTGMPSGIAPNAAIGTTNTTLGTILGVTSVSNVTYCGDPTVMFNTPIIKPYRFDFATPVTAPTSTGFFASVVLPTATGDTAVVFNNGNASVNTSYERWSPASPTTWYEMETAWGGSTPYNLAILPIMTCPTAIKSNSILDNNITLYPNPSTGVFSIIATLPGTQSLEISVHNAMGQFIASSKYSGVTNNAFNLDLSAYSNGVYFVTISNGQEKVVKRLILNK